MLSVVIATEESERTLVPTLDALVSGATAGLIREVIVADPGSRDGTAEVADIAGCRMLVVPGSVGARLNAAAAAARAAWLLFLRPGVRPDLTWTDDAGRFIAKADASGQDRAAVFRSPRQGFRARLAEGVRATLGAPNPDHGLLIAKRFYERIGGHHDVAEAEAELLRRLGRRRLITLASAALLDS